MNLRSLFETAKLVPLALLAIVLIGLLFYAPGVITSLLVIFLIGAGVGLLYLVAFNKKAPPPWKKKDD